MRYIKLGKLRLIHSDNDFKWKGRSVYFGLITFKTRPFNDLDRTNICCSICEWDSDTDRDLEKESLHSAPVLRPIWRYSQLSYWIIKKGKRKYRKICDHQFHTRCVYEWLLDRKFCCPQCNKSEKIFSKYNFHYDFKPVYKGGNSTFTIS